VGNAIEAAKIHRALAVHPHGCGERLIGFPLVNAWSRFIPTGVGNAVNLSKAPLALAVHPHGCGERTYLNILLNKRNNRL